MLAGPDALRDVDVERPLLQDDTAVGAFDRCTQRDRALGAAVRILDIDQHLRVVLPALRAAAARCPGGGRAGAADLRLEEVAGIEPFAAGERPAGAERAALAAAKLEAGIPVRRR